MANYSYIMQKLTLATFLSSAVILAGSVNAQEADLDAVKAQWPLFDQYCVSCHNFEDWAGSLAFDTLSPDAVHENRDIFEKVLRKMRGRLMPPPGNEQPAQSDLNSFIASMEGYLDSVSVEEGPNSPPCLL